MTKLFDKLIGLAIDGNEVKLNGKNLKISSLNGIEVEDKIFLKENKESIIDLLLELEIASTKQLAQLSCSQRSLWVIDQLASGKAQYNMPMAIKLMGQVDVDALRKSLQTIVERHEILRTNFIKSPDGTVYQLIREQADITIPVVDISEQDQSEQNLESLRQEEFARPFDLKQDLMIRAKLLQISDHMHILLITIHHIASDGWSQGVLVQECSALYNAFSKQRTSPLPPLSMQYRDFAHQQFLWMQSEQHSRHLNFWLDKLQNLPPVHNLPTDFSRPCIQQYAGAAITRKLDTSFTKTLNQFAGSQNVTLFMFLQTVLAVLLGKYSGDEDIVIGTPTANRRSGKLNSLVGLFTNSLVLRTNLSDDPPFSDILTANKEYLLGAYEFQEFPFEKLVDELQPERNTGYSPLVQVMLLMQNFEQNEFSLDGLTLSQLDGAHNIAKYDLTLKVQEHNGYLELVWNYSTGLFTQETIERMAQHFEKLLKAATENPGARISQLPYLTTEERELFEAKNQGLQRARDSGKGAFDGKCIHEVFEQQSVKSSQACALVFPSEDGKSDIHISYDTLNKKANQIAHFLRKQGVTADALVGLSVERSPSMVIAILAILKAGGAYVPLPPDLPDERLEYIVKDAKLSIILTEESTASRFSRVPLLDDCRLVRIDDSVLFQALPEDNLALGEEEVNADNLAYVIYTSGSTGNPKGVLVEHRNVTRLFEATRFGFEFTNDDVWTLFHSYAFDFSVWEIWGALLFGGQLVVVPYWVSRSTSDFYHLVQSHKVTVLNQTPSAFKQFIEADKQLNGELELRYVIFGGEALNLTTLSPWMAKFGDSSPQLINMYGITETTVHVTYARIDKNMVASSQQFSPIGLPIGDLGVVVLDKNKNLAPLGVVGELYVRGAGLTRGYLNRTELTNARFHSLSVFEKSGLNDGDRYYRTGDLVRWKACRESGDVILEYVGRCDTQVKIRGFRIELGEVEAALLKHPEVIDAVLIARQNPDRLIAYVKVMDLSDQNALCTSLANHLSCKLPSYMVPSSFVPMTEFPLTPNGKIDIKSLPDAKKHSSNDEQLTQPGNSHEALLCEIWKSLLKIDKVSVTDNFFALGGDSILSIQMVTYAARQGLTLTTRQIFENQTIRELVQQVNTLEQVIAPQGDVTGQQLLIPIQHQFLSAQKRQDHYNQSMFLTAPKALSLDLLEMFVGLLYQRHDILRMSVVGTHADIKPFAKYFVSRAIRTADVTGLDSSQRETEFVSVGTQAKQSLSLKDADLCRIVLFEDKDGPTNYLLLTINHMAVDGVSWRIILEDLSKFYNDVTADKQPELANKTSSFQQWGEALSRYANSDELAQQREYWLQQANANWTSLPIDNHDVASNRIADSRQVIIELNAKNTSILLSECTAAYHTQINTILLSALYLGLKKWADGHVFRIDLEGHGRESIDSQVDTSQTVGWFTTLFPVNLAVEAGSDVHQTIQSVKEILRLIPDNGIGFGLLRWLRNDEQIINAYEDKPATIAFNYLGQFDQVLDDDNPFKMASSDVGPDICGECTRSHAIVFNGLVKNGKLKFSIGFNGLQFEHSTIEKLADSVVAGFEQLIEHCHTRKQSGVTPNDFPLAQVSAAQLDALHKQHPGLVDLYPATEVQQGLLFHSDLNASAYVLQIQITLQGKLDASILRQAWQKVVDDHEVLRTIFVQDKTHQLVLPEYALDFESLNWLELESETQKLRFQALLDADKEKGFNPEQTPLLRVKVVQLDENQSHILITHHHAILDGWGNSIVIAQVVSHYLAMMNQGEATLPKSLPYRNYIEWLQSQDFAAAKRFWSENLSNLTEPTQIGLDKLTGNNSELAAKEQWLHFSHEQTDQFRNLAKSYNITLNTLVQAAWSLLLHMYSGKDVVCFGETVSGRPAELNGIEQMVGLFINSLPVCVEFKQDESLADWLRKIHADGAKRGEYGFLPLAQIQEQSCFDAQVQLFSTLVVFDNYPISEVVEDNFNKPDLEVIDVHNFAGTNYDLTLDVSPTDNLKVKFSYSNSIFNDATIVNIKAHFEQVLEQFLDNQNKRIADIALLSAEEQKQLNLSNATSSQYPEHLCVHQLIEQQAELTPDNIAIVLEGTGLQTVSMTYKEMNERANQVAHYLISDGVKPDDVVGLYVERSVEMIVGILGILKAGAAYVPIDPSYPEGRVQRLVEDTALALVLTDSELLATAPFEDQKLLPIDVNMHELLLGRQPTHNPDPQILNLSSDNLAYVLFTSGSTGVPKGVMIEHKNVVNYLCYARDNYLQNSITGSVVSSPLVFDATITSLYVPLCAGKSVTLIADTDLGAIQKHLHRHLFESDKPKLFKLTPAHLQMLQSGNTKQVCSDVKHTIVIGGEQLTKKVLAPFKDKLLPGATYINEYGPTETVVGCSVYWLNEHDRCESLDAINIPIGKGISNTQLFVFNKQMQQQVIGAYAELYIGGKGVGRGYFNNEKLTKESFITNPLDTPGVPRLYKTGDIVRWLPDGNLEFSSRADEQVKIRGFRIETGEIENLLNSFESVNAAVVLAKKQEDDHRLFAYLVLNDDAVEPSEFVLSVRHYLINNLPGYMVPSGFIILDTIPMTTNGKVDKAALLKINNTIVVGDYVAPETELEKGLAEIWADLLKLNVETISSGANFFELGGHSLLSIRLITEIRDRYQVKLPVQDIFDTPQLSGLAKRISCLSGTSFSSSIKALSRDGSSINASFAQQRLWFIDQLDGKSTQYNIPVAVELQGRVDEFVVEKALNIIIQRHESLRTNFYSDDGRVFQIIKEDVSLELDVVSLEDLSEPVQQNALKAAIAQNSQYSFDLANELLLKGTFIRINDDKGYLLLNMHHIVTDGWSMGIFYEEFSRIYSSLRNKQYVPVKKPEITYADYAVWQSEWMQSPAMESQLAYWKEQLAALPQIHSLPLDKQRPLQPSFRGAMYKLKTSPELQDRLIQLASAQGVTVFMLLHAVFGVLLARHSNSEDIVVGTPVANRGQKELENIIGFFVNTLVLRTQVQLENTFIDYLHSVKRVNIDALSNQDIPFEYLVEQINPVRSLSHSPLYQVMFSMDTNFADVPAIERVNAVPFELQKLSAQHDLTLFASQQEDGLQLSFEYSTDLFEHKRISIMAEHFVRLLTGILDNPQQPIADFPMLSQQEVQYQLQTLNQTKSPFPQDKLLHELIEQQVERSPDAIAVMCADQDITYLQLNEKANQLARYLVELGVKPGTVVGLYLRLSIDLVIGMLAILKSGGAYVPMDPDYPPARLDFMLEDCQAPIVITETRLANNLKGNAQCNVLLMDSDALSAIVNELSRQNLSTQELGLTPQDLLYLIYTSGSTGRPKGVMIPHINEVNLVIWYRDEYNFDCNSRVYVVSSLSFDLTQKNFFTPLICGAALCLNPADNYDIEVICELNKTYKATHVNCAPSVIYAITDEGKNWLGLNYILLGGESIKTSWLQKWAGTTTPRPRIINMYGPTECTDISSQYEVTQENLNESGQVPIGRPTANVILYVLDPHLNLCPIGTTGELYVGGMGVGYGYHNNPELTAQKFIPNPYSEQTSDKIYKTGDMVRMSEDGNIEFIGRVDDQVKIRGMRIEPGEVERLLASSSLVKSCCVLLHTGLAGNPQLVAFFVPKDAALQATDLKAVLRSELGQKLPDYMVPSILISLQKLPLTPNGKVDKSRLTEHIEQHKQDNFVVPATPTEKRLVVIWAELLNLEGTAISANADFFGLGGHSLLSVKLVAAICKEFGVVLSVKAIFSNSSVSQLSQRIDEQVSRGTQQFAMPVIARSQPNADGLFEISFSQQRFWLLDRLNGGSAEYNMPMVFQIVGELQLTVLQHVIHSLIERHEILRTVYVEQDGVVLQRIRSIKDIGGPEIPMVSLESLSEEQQSDCINNLLWEDACKVFDLKEDLMLRARFIKQSWDKGVLIFTIHHIAADGWSCALLKQEFMQLYHAYEQGLPNPLAPLSLHYTDYAQWQSETFRIGEEQVAYWLKQLSDAPLQHSLPLDHARPVYKKYDGARYSGRLSAETARKLEKLAQAHQLTPFMLLHSVFALLLSRHSNSTDIVVGTPFANRQQQELDSMVGCFVNTLVLRVNTFHHSLNDYFAHVRQVHLDAQGYQDVPFELLVDRLQVPRNSSYTPLFQIMLTNGSDFGVPAEIVSKDINLSIEPLSIENTPARFDLNVDLSFTEQGLSLEWVYDVALFDPPRIEQLNVHLCRLFDVLSDTTIPAKLNLNDVSVLSPLETHTLAQALKGQPADHAQAARIHVLFEDQARRCGERTALICADASLTYKALNERANQWAHYLRTHHQVGHGTLVGLCASRSVEMVVGLLAILKTGGAYVPLDPTYPDERLHYILSDAGIKVVLAQSECLERFSDYTGDTVILTSELGEQTFQRSTTHNLPDASVAEPSDLAYIIYTSGSTGQPKGVMTPHRAVTRLVVKTDFMELNENTVMLHAASISFDAATIELWGPLLNGGCCVIYPDSVIVPQKINQLVDEHRVNSLWLTSALFSEWSREPATIATLRQVLAGGDVLDIAAIKRCQMYFPHVQLINGYGPTENTTFSSFYAIPSDFDDVSVPIGKPIRGDRGYVVGKHLGLVPQGVIGELWIGGDGLALGYLNQPELSNEKFVANPFYDYTDAECPKRLYRTGDLVQQNHVGNLLFIGRVDEQLKLRGFRIELSEIAATINLHSSIDSCVVVPVESGNGDTQIVAYVKFKEPETSETLKAIKNHVARILPAYMVPAHIITITDWPITANGKVDKKSLPPVNLHFLYVEIIPPETPTECKLAEIWAELLGIPLDSVARTSDFFELGGHSLLAVRQQVEIREQFDCELDVRQLFEFSILSEIASLVDLINNRSQLKDVIGSMEEHDLERFEF
uniref:Non-ribosomal peptide synthetase modules, pyoverdine @ Siderophore biosynthesis non-ribosomal peptide synthetase modules n=1 Tax=Rheinheimera sp. BAL341 TaxID=1708203 RepID=A0A486XPV7_9GAMM